MRNIPFKLGQKLKVVATDDEFIDMSITPEREGNRLRKTVVLFQDSMDSARSFITETETKKTWWIFNKCLKPYLEQLMLFEV